MTSASLLGQFPAQFGRGRARGGISVDNHLITNGTQKKIGILTFHRCINYGSYWQARCLLEAVRGLGYSAELLDFHSCGATTAEWRVGMRPTLPQPNEPGDLGLYRSKVRAFSKAIEQMPRSRQFDLNRPEQLGAYDSIIVGSDEIWNLQHPWFGGIPAFFGVGLPSKNKIAYAGSFGNHSCWEGLGEPYTDFLQGLSHVSVRDENSWWMLKNSLGWETPLVLDPCLLNPPDLPEGSSIEGPFAMVYGHNFSDQFVSQARDWAAATRTRLVSVGYRNGWADTQMLDVGPLQFAALVRNADAVLTNFFHGCIFALVGEKPYGCEVSPYRSIKVRGLAELLGAEHRLVGRQTTPRHFSDLLTTPPDPRELERVKRKRTESLRFLSNSLEQS